MDFPTPGIGPRKRRTVGPTPFTILPFKTSNPESPSGACYSSRNALEGRRSGSGRVCNEERRKPPNLSNGNILQPEGEGQLHLTGRLGNLNIDASLTDP